MERSFICEIKKKLGCEISIGNFVERCIYGYPFAIVDLSCYEAAVVSSVPVAKEYAELEWAPPDVPMFKKMTLIK